MQPESSLPCSQKPASYPFSKPYQSSPHPTCFFKTWFDIIVPPTSRFSKWSLSFRLSHQNSVRACPFPWTSRMLRPYHSSWFSHSDNTLRATAIMKVSLLIAPQICCYLLLFSPKYFPQYSIFKRPQPTFFRQSDRTIFTSVWNNRQNYSSLHFNLHIFG